MILHSPLNGPKLNVAALHCASWNFLVSFGQLSKLTFDLFHLSWGIQSPEPVCQSAIIKLWPHCMIWRKLTQANPSTKSTQLQACKMWWWDYQKTHFSTYLESNHACQQASMLFTNLAKQSHLCIMLLPWITYNFDNYPVAIDIQLCWLSYID